MLVVIFVVQNSIYGVDAIIAESAESVSLHHSKERLTARHMHITTENGISSVNNLNYVPDNITVRSSQVYPLYQQATGDRPGSATLVRKLNSVSKSGEIFDDQNRAASFLTANVALDQPSSLYSSKPYHGLIEKHSLPETALLLPAAHPTNRAEKERIVSESWLANYRAPRTDMEQRATHPEPVAALPNPATADSASARGTPLVAEAAADRLAALQEFLRTIEQLDRAP